MATLMESQIYIFEGRKYVLQQVQAQASVGTKRVEKRRGEREGVEEKQTHF